MPKEDNLLTKRTRYRRQIALFMQHDLPSVTEQRAKPFRPTEGQARYYFRLLNLLIFGNRLRLPKITVRRLHGAWGQCRGDENLVCEIDLTDRFYCRQWFLIVLAHEMCHQYQWEVLGQQRVRRGRRPIMSHGPSFFIFRESLRRFGIPLKTAVRTQRWFLLQDFSRV